MSVINLSMLPPHHEQHEPSYHMKLQSTQLDRISVPQVTTLLKNICN